MLMGAALLARCLGKSGSRSQKEVREHKAPSDVAKFTLTSREDHFRGGDQLGTSLCWSYDPFESFSSKSIHRGGRQEKLLLSG